MNMDRQTILFLLSIPIIFIISFFAVPFGMVAIESFKTIDGSWGMEQYTKLLSGWFYIEVLAFTFKISFWVTLCSFIIGYPIAYYMTRVIKRKWLRRLLYIVVITPLFTSNIVRSFGWMILLGRRGLVNETLISIGVVDSPLQLLSNEVSIIIGMTYIMTPFMVLTIAAILQNIDRTLEIASRDLGAGALTTFLKVTLPLSLPGVIAGTLIVFTLTVSAYVTPSILSGGKKTVMSMLIYQQYSTLFDYNFGAALSLSLLITTIGLLSIYGFIKKYTKKSNTYKVK